MGSYDSLHTGDRCAQVKCLGRRHGNLVPGDDAVLHRVATLVELAEIGEPTSPGAGATPAELEAWADHPHTRLSLTGEPRPETSWQVPMDDGSFALFVDRRFAGFADIETADVVVVDNLGRDVGDGDGGRGALGPRADCRICAAWGLDGGWAELLGAAAPVDVVAQLLGVSRDELVARVDAGELLAVGTAEGRLVCPLAQFTVSASDIVVREGLAETLAALRAPDPLAAARWLGTANRRCNGETPWAHLGSDITAVVAAAAAQADTWAESGPQAVPTDA